MPLSPLPEPTNSNVGESATSASIIGAKGSKSFPIRLFVVPHGEHTNSPRGLEDDCVEVFAAFGEVVERSHEVPAHGAAHAAVVHGDDVLLGLDLLHHQALVDVHLQSNIDKVLMFSTGSLSRC